MTSFDKQQPSDRVTVAAALYPNGQAAATRSTGYVSMAQFAALLAIVQWGDLGSSGTIDAKLRQATDSSGTGVKDITGKAITQVAQATSPSEDQREALINLTADELDVDNGFTHVKLDITVGAATSECSGLILGLDPRYGDASHASSVQEVVA